MIFGDGKLDDLRPCLVDGDMAYFHRWIDEDEVILQLSATLHPSDAQRVRRDFAEGRLIPPNCEVVVVRNFYALIEYLDGTVEKVDPERIQFTDA